MAEHILMIDDDKNLSAMLGEYLTQLGMQVTARTTATEGLKLLRHGEFDALILDVMLPDVDGFEVCRRVRTESDIPILGIVNLGHSLAF
jgi:two-component system, OmpR family, phosphate regulon response regulator OmpR